METLQGLGTIALLAAVFFYGFKVVRWLWRKILWRVRRRLVVTYLFVGLTPIVLLSVLSMLGAFGASAEAMARLIAVQAHGTVHLSGTIARALAAEISRLPPGSDEQSLASWLSQKDASLQAALPASRLALWIGEKGQPPAEIAWRATDLTASPVEGEDRGIGIDSVPDGASLPPWLTGIDEWSGIVFLSPSAGSRSRFGTPLIRSLARGETRGRPFALLLTVPVTRALLDRFRAATNIRVHPYFIGIEDVRALMRDAETPAERRGMVLDANVPAPFRSDAAAGLWIVAEPGLDQFGEPSPVFPYLVTLRATHWLDGARDEHPAFLFSWSPEEASQQLLGSSFAGREWKRLLLVVGLGFLVLELLALLAAVLITRAVTGTVHELYAATERIERGDFSYRAPVRSNDQLGNLAGAFNEMSARVEELLVERMQSERLRREIEIAAEVQARLFPRATPPLATASIAGGCHAALGVAGDYYDYVEIAPGRVLLALGDVSGKGLPAAIVMSNLQAALRALAAVLVKEAAAAGPPGAAGSSDPPGSISAVATAINEQLCRSTDENRYATLFLALYDDATRRLSYTNAGHNAPVLARADGSVERLGASGTIVGAFPGARYEEAEADLLPGDLLLVFSDGISEAADSAEELYGEDRVVLFVSANRTLSVEAFQVILTRLGVCEMAWMLLGTLGATVSGVVTVTDDDCAELLPDMS